MDPIDLWVIRPVGVKNPPVVLYLYGFPSETDRFHDDRVCQRLVQGGAAAVGFVSALTGYRAEHRPPKEWFVRELPESLASTVHDVQLILNYLETRGDLDMGRVGMFGQGSGGAIAILAAATDSRIKAVDLLNPWGDWPDWLAKAPLVPKDERAAYLQLDFLKRLEPLEPVRYLPALKSCTVRIQFFADDVNAPKEVADKLTAAAPSTAKIGHYPNARASFAASAGAPLFEWIAAALKSPTEKKDDTANTLPAASVR
jgi:acetyl esterase/lipase